jgi:hypothetical protein
LQEGNKRAKQEEFGRQDELTQKRTLMLFSAAKFHHDGNGEAISVESEIERAMEVVDVKADRY